jgi:adenylate cyclase
VLPWEKQLARPTTKFAISPARSRSWTWATAAVAVLLVVGGGWWWWATRRSSATRDKTRSEVAQQTENIPAKSIAVLPFENLSEEKQTEYFADGVQDEIMTRLASIGDLKVISRTSTAKYKSKPEDLKTLSQQLGVATVLEGSVQRAEGKVRVNVQLLDARADTHLWADTYDRPLTDIFAVESDIATRIANALQAKLTGNERAKIAERPTQNTEAHDLYFKAHMLEAKSTHEDALKAIEYYKQAIALDPNYAVAYAELSQALTYDTGYSRMPAAELLIQARVAAEKALALDPNLPEAHVSLGAIALSEMNIKEAKSEFERAIALNSNLSGAHYYLSMLLAAEGQFDASIVEAKRAIQLDPLSLVVRERLGNTYRYARRYPEAKKIFETVIQLNPAYAQAQDSLGICLELTGDLDGAVAHFKKSFQLDHDFHSVVFLAHCYAIKGEREKATQTLAEAQELEKKAGAEWAYGYALVYMGLGDQKQAVDWLERSYQAKESFALLLIIKVDPLLDPLRGNPRFEALVNKIIPSAAI